MRPARRAAVAVAVLALLGALCGAGALFYLQSEGVAPRALAPYLERRASGHNDLITGTGDRLGAVLRQLDRGAEWMLPMPLPALRVGAQEAPLAQAPGTLKPVDSSEAALRAFAGALAGDVITFAPGVYRFAQPVYAVRPGVAGAPVVVRAQRPGTVTIELATREGFVVRAPHWRFENLTIRGACRQQAWCDHAFHVVGAGSYFAAINNTVLDFNAHFKINGLQGVFPDHGLIEGNTLSNGTPRRTTNPVTPIDLVAASDWTVRGNLIADFVKDGGDRISYGAFAKGAGARNVFERNVVWCEARLRGRPGQRIGLSLGGGGTGKPYCRDRQCISEQQEGVLRDNLVAGCSDAGIYLNRAAASRIEHNTLIDTTGIDVRFAASSARADGNLVDGPIRARDDGLLHLGDNRSSALAWSYLGWHPVRSLVRDWDGADLAWKGNVPRRAAPAQPVDRPDLCGRPRGAAPAYGAFEDFAPCVAPLTSSSSPAN